MKTFKYSFLATLVYRYANIPITLVMGFYFITSLFSIGTTKWAILSAAVHLLIILVVNRYYFKLYRLFPYNIEADNEKMICTNYFLSGKKVTMYFSDMTKLYGGIFDNKSTAPIYLEDSKGNKIGVSQHLTDINKFTTLVLSNVPKALYDEALERLASFREKPRK